MKTLAELNEELDEAVNEEVPTFAQEQLLYSLKNYVDGRFAILEEKLKKSGKE